MRTRITIAKINAVKVSHGEVKLWDDAVVGLCLRCFTSGGKSWAYRYREGAGGRSAKILTLRLGSWPSVSIDHARAAAKAHAGLIAQGNDPAAVRREARRQEKSTIGRIIEEGGAYQRSLEARGIVKRREAMSVLRRGLSRFAHTDIAKLSRQDLVAAINALEGLPGAQAELRKHCSGLLEWAVNGGLVQANVLAGMRKPKRTRAERIEADSKRRALDDADIIRVWRAADRNGSFGGLVQFALLTAMRRNEIAHLRRDAVSGDRIIVAAAQAKTGVLHEVPLTDMMRSVIARQPLTTSPLIFPSGKTGRAMIGWTSLKRQVADDADIGSWTLHDCRRTCRTLMSRLGISEAVAELAIGHVRGGLIPIYDRDSRWPERVDAFQRVSDHIAGLVRRSREK